MAEIKGKPKDVKKEAKKKEKKGKKKEVKGPREEAWKIIMHPLLTEKSIGLVEGQNKLVFVVRTSANKRQIKWAIENALGVKVDAVNTMIDRKGRKKATVKLSKEFRAADIATRFGML